MNASMSPTRTAIATNEQFSREFERRPKEFYLLTLHDLKIWHESLLQYRLSKDTTLRDFSHEQLDNNEQLVDLSKT